MPARAGPLGEPDLLHDQNLRRHPASDVSAAAGGSLDGSLARPGSAGETGRRAGYAAGGDGEGPADARDARCPDLAVAEPEQSVAARGGATLLGLRGVHEPGNGRVPG